MEKANFDDIARGLLVFLKGQIPSIQGKTSREDLVRQIQSIVYMLRNSVIQLEGATFSDPRSTPEFKDLVEELAGLKRTNQRLEESLFLEMNKTQRLTQDCDKASAAKAGVEKRSNEDQKFIASLQEQIENFKKAMPPSVEIDGLMKNYEQRITELKDQNDRLKKKSSASGSIDFRIRNYEQPIAELLVQNDQLKKTSSLAGRADRRIQQYQEQIDDLLRQIEEQKSQLARSARFPIEEKARLENDLKDAEIHVSTLQKSLAGKAAELDLVKDLLRDAAKEGLAERENGRILGTQLEEARAKIADMEFRLGQAVNKPLPSRPDDLETIHKLREEISTLQAALKSRLTPEVFTHLQAAAESKIAFLEKSLLEFRKNAGEKTTQVEMTPENIENLKRDKVQLEQRVIDMEATVRRLMASREKSLEEPSQRTPALRSEEFVFFFEVLSTVSNRLAKSPENRDIRQKAEEGIAILEKNHAIEGIPTVGFPFDERLHKVVRAFQTALVADSTIVFEASRGFKTAEHVIQRAIVWIAKSKFRCSECSAPTRPQDNFCPKCGMELCAPDGTTKRKLQPLPSTVEVDLPLIDHCIGQSRIQEANDLLAYLAKEHPEHPEVQKRRGILAKMTIEPTVR